MTLGHYHQPLIPPLDPWVAANFKQSEFRCSHCGQYAMQPEFVAMLQAFRDFLDYPVRVVSGYRCRWHPIEAAKYIGNATRTPGTHERGIASDIACRMLTVADLNAAAEQFGRFSGIGYNEEGNTIHVDTRNDPARWAYDHGRVVGFRLVSV